MFAGFTSRSLQIGTISFIMLCQGNSCNFLMLPTISSKYVISQPLIKTFTFPVGLPKAKTAVSARSSPLRTQQRGERRNGCFRRLYYIMQINFF